MVKNHHPEKTESLGEFLLRARKEKQLTLTDIAAETRIPATTLRAMEADDRTVLPAEAFARGFYVLYARALDLDTEDVLRRYDEQSGTNSDTDHSPRPLQHEKKINSMATGSAGNHASFVGIALLLIVAVVALTCFYFSWNPATFLSEKLRDMQKPDSTATQREGQIHRPADPGNGTTQPPTATSSLLTANFAGDTTVTISIDDNFPEKMHIAAGSTHSWHADQTMTLILPRTAAVSLLYNGSPLPLPEPVGDFITITLP
jgi:cytoskeletal protein RodZ